MYGSTRSGFVVDEQPVTLTPLPQGSRGFLLQARVVKNPIAFQAEDEGMPRVPAAAGRNQVLQFLRLFPLRRDTAAVLLFRSRKLAT